MTSPETVISKLILSPLPILIADTCSLLDVLRAPVRFEAGELRAAMFVWMALTHPQPSVYLVLPEIIWNVELKQRRGSAEENLREFCNQYKTPTRSLQWWCSVVGARMPPDPEPFTSGLIQSLTEIFDGITGAACHLDEQTKCIDPAYQRVKEKRAPAHRKGEMKDAVIVEEVLELSRLVRDRGFNPPIVLLSANHDDYLDNEGGIHGDIAKDFNPLQITFSLNWTEARHSLGI